MIGNPFISQEGLQQASPIGVDIKRIIITKKLVSLSKRKLYSEWLLELTSLFPSIFWENCMVSFMPCLHNWKLWTFLPKNLDFPSQKKQLVWRLPEGRAETPMATENYLLKFQRFGLYSNVGFLFFKHIQPQLRDKAQ